MTDDLETRLKCLDLASRFSLDPAMVVPLARSFFDFVQDRPTQFGMTPMTTEKRAKPRKKSAK